MRLVSLAVFLSLVGTAVLIPTANDQCKILYGPDASFCQVHFPSFFFCYSSSSSLQQDQGFVLSALQEFKSTMCSLLACRIKPTEVYCNNITTIAASEGTRCGPNQVGHLSLMIYFLAKRLISDDGCRVDLYWEGMRRERLKPDSSNDYDKLLVWRRINQAIRFEPFGRRWLEHNHSFWPSLMLGFDVFDRRVQEIALLLLLHSSNPQDLLSDLSK